MPMIDVYAVEGNFRRQAHPGHGCQQAAVMRWEAGPADLILQ